MRKVTFTLKFEITDEDFNSEKFQEMMSDMSDEEQIKKEFQEDFERGRILEAKVVVT